MKEIAKAICRAKPSWRGFLKGLPFRPGSRVLAKTPWDHVRPKDQKVNYLLYIMKYFYYLLALPCIFLGAYLVVRHVVPDQQVTSPMLVGLSFETAATIAANQQINVRIARVDTTNAYAANTVLEQYPTAGSPMRQNSPIYVVLTALPQQSTTPLLIGQQLQSVQQQLHQHGTKLCVYHVPSQLPTGQIIAQIPAAGSPATGVISVYVVAPTNTSVVVPNLIGQSYETVYEWAQQLGLALQLSSGPHFASSIIEHQWPYAGTVTSKDTLMLQISTSA